MLLLLIGTLLASCGFHLRTADQWPPQLRRLAVITPNPDSSFSAALSGLLHSMDVTIVPKQHARYILQITKVTFTPPANTESNTNTPVQAYYTLSIAYKLTNHQGKAIQASSVTSTQLVTLTANQLVSDVPTGNLQNTLQQDALNQLYERMTSLSLYSKLKHHAD